MLAAETKGFLYKDLLLALDLLKLFADYIDFSA